MFQTTNQIIGGLWDLAVACCYQCFQVIQICSRNILAARLATKGSKKTLALLCLSSQCQCNGRFNGFQLTSKHKIRTLVCYCLSIQNIHKIMFGHLGMISRFLTI